MTRGIRWSVRYILVLVVVVFSASCATQVNPNHPLFETQPDVAAASVYFIRPFTYRERGVADNPVNIEINNIRLLELGKGEYTLIRIKPEKVKLTTRNLSQFTNNLQPVELTRETELNLEPGKTYFLHIKQVNEEFRGVYYLAEQVDLATARTLIQNSDPVGAADNAPIDRIPAN